jgi:pimeloyl-ACP methyl ester carboxylesterase
VPLALTWFPRRLARVSIRADRRALPDARWELFAGASHCTHLERPERFLELVESFLSAHE